MNDEEQFDAVETMRQIREGLSRELAGKSFEQQKRYIRERIALPYTPEAKHSTEPDTVEH